MFFFHSPILFCYCCWIVAYGRRKCTSNHSLCHSLCDLIICFVRPNRWFSICVKRTEWTVFFSVILNSISEHFWQLQRCLYEQLCAILWISSIDRFGNVWLIGTILIALHIFCNWIILIGPENKAVKLDHGGAYSLAYSDWPMSDGNRYDFTLFLFVYFRNFIVQ